MAFPLGVGLRRLQKIFCLCLIPESKRHLAKAIYFIFFVIIDFCISKLSGTLANALSTFQKINEDECPFGSSVVRIGSSQRLLSFINRVQHLPKQNVHPKVGYKLTVPVCGTSVGHCWNCRVPKEFQMDSHTPTGIRYTYLPNSNQSIQYADCVPREKKKEKNLRGRKGRSN